MINKGFLPSGTSGTKRDKQKPNKRDNSKHTTPPLGGVFACPDGSKVQSSKNVFSGILNYG